MCRLLAGFFCVSRLLLRTFFVGWIGKSAQAESLCYWWPCCGVRGLVCCWRRIVSEETFGLIESGEMARGMLRHYQGLRKLAENYSDKA